MARQAKAPGAAIRTLREMANLTLKEVAQGADTSIAYLSKVENEAMMPTPSYVSRVTAYIARELGRAA